MKFPVPKTVIVTETADRQLELLEPTAEEVKEILSLMRAVARGEQCGDRLLFGRQDEYWLEAGRFVVVYGFHEQVWLRAIHLRRSGS